METEDYFILAFKNLKHRGIRSWLTLLGIVIGVTAVIALIGLGNGLKAAVNSQFQVSSTQALTVQAGGLNSYGLPGSGVVKPLTTDDVVAIGKLGVVEVATPRNLETIKLEFNNKVIIGTGLSIEIGLEKEMYETMGLEAEQGRLLLGGNLKNIMLGGNFADKTKSGFDKAVEVGKSITINSEKLNVVGILKKQGSFMVDNTVFVYDEELKKLTGYGDTVDIIGVKVKSPDLMNQAKEDIEKLLRKRRNVKEGEEDFSVETPQALLSMVNNIIGGIQIFIVIIASISIFIGAIGIINTMTTSVLERKKEIGIMKSVGARNSHIFFQFFVESGLLGLVGGIIGILLGTLISFGGVLGLNSFLGSDVSLSINYVFIGVALLGSFLIGGVSGIAPAMSAARQNPVEALRK